jgi:hypothetical protein
MDRSLAFGATFPFNTNGSQVLVTDFRDGQTPAPAPEPGTAALGLFALAATGLFALPKRRKELLTR